MANLTSNPQDRLAPFLQQDQDGAADWSQETAHSAEINVAEPERIASVVGGAVLMLLGIKRMSAKSLFGLVLAAGGGALIQRGVSGHCVVYARLGKSTAHGAGQVKHYGVEYEDAVTIRKPRSEVFAFWRRFENLPRVMQHLESVHGYDATRSHWVAKLSITPKLEWDAEIVREEEGRLISWRSLPGSLIETRGVVSFEDAEGGRSTAVRVRMEYSPPGGPVGETVAHFFDKATHQQIREDLRRFKNIMEAGEIPTIEGQPRGAQKESSFSARQIREDLRHFREVLGAGGQSSRKEEHGRNRKDTNDDEVQNLGGAPVPDTSLGGSAGGKTFESPQGPNVGPAANTGTVGGSLDRSGRSPTSSAGAMGSGSFSQGSSGTLGDDAGKGGSSGAFGSSDGGAGADSGARGASGGTSPSGASGNLGRMDSGTRGVTSSRQDLGSTGTDLGARGLSGGHAGTGGTNPRSDIATPGSVDPSTAGRDSATGFKGGAGGTNLGGTAGANTTDARFTSDRDKTNKEKGGKPS